MTVPHEAGTKIHESAAGDSLAGAVRTGDPAALVGYYRSRSAAALAACSRLCAPDRIGEALEAAFAEVFDAASAGEIEDEHALDRRLRAAVRSAAADRFGSELSLTAGPPPAGARRVADRVAGAARGAACEHMPRLLAARPEGVLSQADRDRMQEHLRRCPACAAAEARFDEAERAYNAVAGEAPPESVERSLVARFAAQLPPGDEPPVIAVPDDALEGLVDDDADLDHAPADGVAVLDPEQEEPEAYSDDFAPIEDADVVADEPASLAATSALPVTRPLRRPPHLRDDTADRYMPARYEDEAEPEPAGRRERRPGRALAGIALLAAALVAAWAATTALWQEPVSAVLTSSNGDGGASADPRPAAAANQQGAVTVPAAPAAGPTAAERRAASRLKALGARELAQGMSGADVRMLQRLLGAPATGFFGPATLAALRKFQSDQGLEQTGRADSATKRALARRRRVPASAPVAPGTGTQAAPSQQAPGAGGATPSAGTQTRPTPGGAAPPPAGSPGGGAVTP